MSRWPVAGPSEYWPVASSPAFKVKKKQCPHSTTNTHKITTHTRQLQQYTRSTNNKYPKDNLKIPTKNGHYQAPKHVFVLYVENTLYSTNKYSCIRRLHTLYIYCIWNWTWRSCVNHDEISGPVATGIQGVTGGTDQTSGGCSLFKLYRKTPKHLYPKLNGLGDNGQWRLKLWQLLHTYWLPNSYWN